MQYDTLVLQLGARIIGQQPSDRFNQLQRDILSDIASLHQLA